MADSEQEPSIEEILASIRQIISDDDGAEPAAAEPEPPPPPPKAAPKRKPEPEPEPEDDVLELTDKVDDEPAYEPPPRVQIDMKDADDDDDGDSIFTDSAESAAFQGFAKLAARSALDRRGTGDTTIEDIVREMMKPMLREWLDIHLPPLIEKVVQRELRKVAARAADEE